MDPLENDLAFMLADSALGSVQVTCGGESTSGWFYEAGAIRGEGRDAFDQGETMQVMPRHIRIVRGTLSGLARNALISVTDAAGVTTEYRARDILPGGDDHRDELVTLVETT